MRKWLYLLVTVALFSGIFWFSSKDAKTSTAQSDEVIVQLRLMTEEEMVAQPEKASDYRYIIRKGAHFTLYLILGIFVFLTLYEFTHALGFSVLLGQIMTMILAGVDEYHQSYVPGRSMEFTDVLIDGCGALLGITLLFLFIKSKRSKKPFDRVYYFGR